MYFTLGLVHLCAKWRTTTTTTLVYWIIMRVDEWIKRFVELNTLYELRNSPQFL